MNDNMFDADDDDFNASEFERRFRNRRKIIKIGIIIVSLITLSTMILFWK